MKNFCESLKEHVMDVINFEKKKMIALTVNIAGQECSHICREKCKEEDTDDKKYRKVKDHCHYAELHCVRFMTTSLSNHVIHEGIHKIKCKYNMMIKNMKNVELNTNIASAILNM